MRYACLWLFLAFSPIVGWAAAPHPASPASKITISSVNATRGGKPPQFDQSVAIVFKSPPPPSSDLQNVADWTVFVYATTAWTITGTHMDGGACTAHPNPLILHGTGSTFWGTSASDERGFTCSERKGPSDPKNNPSIVKVNGAFEAILILPPDTLSEKVTSMLISFNAAQGSAQSLWTPPALPTKTPPLFTSAATKTDSDNYITGLYSPAVHSAAQYNIDAQGSFLGHVSPHVWLGAMATMSTNNRPTADPDSYFVSGILDWVAIRNPFFWKRAEGVALVWDLAGLEFDRKTTTKSFISSPAVEVPIRIINGKALTTDLLFYSGIETGSNISNALAPAGSGFLFRGLAGSKLTFMINSHKLKFFSPLKLTSNYTARIPARDEVFTYTQYISATGKSISLPVMSDHVRNHVKSELDLPVKGPFTITVKHEYGELPPGFRVVHNSISIGVSLTLQQRNAPSTGTINPEN